MSKQTQALKLALEALEDTLSGDLTPYQASKTITAIRKALAEQPAQQQEPVRVPVADNTYNYAKSLAEAIFKQHFASDEHYASGRIVWGVNDTVIGILTQIDNMVADMVRKPAQQQEPVATDWERIARVQDAKLRAMCDEPGGFEKLCEVMDRYERTSPQPSKPCEWQQEDSEYMPDTWRSDCGVLWTFTDGGPVENDMKHCCGCGAKLREKNHE